MKRVRVQVWTNIYYAKFVGIWYPEEGDDYEPDPEDDRPLQQQNLPVVSVIPVIYTGRTEVVGANPVAPSQHPMPPEVMKRYVRHMAYLFANEWCLVYPDSRIHADLFLEKQVNGYTKHKEVDLIVKQARGSMSLKDLRDHLSTYDDEWLENRHAQILGEGTEDVARRNLGPYLYTPEATTIKGPDGEDVMKTEPEQFITITKVIDVYNMKNPYINKNTLTLTTLKNSLPPGTEDHPGSQFHVNKVKQTIEEDNLELDLLKQYDKMKERMDEMAGPGPDEIPDPTPPAEDNEDSEEVDAPFIHRANSEIISVREATQLDLIKDLKRQLAEAKGTDPFEQEDPLAPNEQIGAE